MPTMGGVIYRGAEMSASSKLRRLTVAHQKPGECPYCDERFNRILATAYEVDTYDCHCGCGQCPADCSCVGNLEIGQMCGCEDGG